MSNYAQLYNYLKAAIDYPYIARMLSCMFRAKILKGETYTLTLVSPDTVNPETSPFRRLLLGTINYVLGDITQNS